MPRLQHKQQKIAVLIDAENVSHTLIRSIRRAADATGLRGGVQQLHLHRVDRGGM